MERELILRWIGNLQRRLKSNEDLMGDVPAENRELKAQIKFLKENLD